MFQGRHVVQDGLAVSAHAAENPAVPAGRDIATGPCVDFHDLARGEELLFLQHDDAAAVASVFVGPDRAMRCSSTIGRFFGPSLLISPCGRWAAVPQIGTMVSISRLSQEAVSSTCGLPWVKIAPSYFPLARIAGPHWSGAPSSAAAARRRGETACRRRTPAAGLGWDIALADIGAQRRP